VIVNVVENAPPGTVTLAGTVKTDVSETDSVTTSPSARARPPSTIVPVAVAPATRLVGTATDAIDGSGVTSMFAVFVSPPYEPEIVTLVG
jgi:hypothetical protein